MELRQVAIDQIRLLEFVTSICQNKANVKKMSIFVSLFFSFFEINFLTL